MKRIGIILSFLVLLLWNCSAGSTFVSADSPLAAQEIRYTAAEAGEVFLVWGINGWQVAPETMRPAGTEIKDKVMHTPMAATGDLFVTRLQVPVGVTIDYGFLITKKRDGDSVSIWEANGEQDYHAVVTQNGVIEVSSKLSLTQPQLTSSPGDASLVTQEIRYQLPPAGEVMFVWGINGWQVLPQAMRPSGTVIQNSVMHTPMTRQADTFTVKIKAPVKTTVDYGFLITKNQNGAAIKSIWDGKPDYRLVATEDRVIEVRADLELLQDQISASMVDRHEQWQGVLLLLIGFGLVFGIGAVKQIPVNQTISNYLAYFTGNTAKLIFFAIAAKVLLLSIAYLSHASALNLDKEFVAFKPAYFEEIIPSFGRADVQWYLDIAQNGYDKKPFSTQEKANWAFYPAWPVILRLSNFLISDMLIAGLILSNIFFLLSVIFLYKLISLDFDEKIAMLAASLLIIFPASQFFSRPGPESFFLFLSLTAFLSARKNRWLLAGIAGSLAVLSRLQGIILILPLLYIYYKQYRSSKTHNLRALSVLMMPSALLLFMLYMYWLTGDIFANFKIQQTWDHGATYPFASMVQFLSTPHLISYYGWDLTVISFIFAFLAVIVIILMVRNQNIPREYIIYAVFSIYLIIARDSMTASLRYLAPVFPIYLAVALLIHNRKTTQDLVFFTLISFQLFYFVSFTHQYNWAAN